MIVGYIVLHKHHGRRYRVLRTGQGWTGKLYSSAGSAKTAISLSGRKFDDWSIYAVNMYDDPDTKAGEVTLVDG